MGIKNKNAKAKSSTKNKNKGKSAKQKKVATSSFAKNGEVLTCVWDVWISGTKLAWDKKSLITSIQVKETVDGSDTATITIADPNFSFLEDNIFIEANKIKIKMGWASYTHRCEFEGYISHVDISFPEDGIPKLTLNCMDKTYRMDRKEKSKTYKKTTSANVVKKICKTYGFKCVVEKGYKFKKQDTISQSNQTDIAFIQKLAQDEVHPFTARLVGSTFYYQKKGDLSADPKMELSYKKYPWDIISFDPKINKVSKESVSSGKTSTKGKKQAATKVSDKYTGTPSVSSGNTPDNSSSKTKNTSSGGKTVKYNKYNRTWNKK